jgi:Nucleoside 2-deoxyribosyltransferase
MRIYMAGPMFTAADAQFNLRLAAKLRAHGFDVYCPNESEPINDKTRTDITGRLIYELDIRNLEGCNVVLLQVGEDSGANWEAGYMDCLARHVDPARYYGVLGMATDIRLRTPPDPAKPGVDNQTGHVNQLVVGGLQLSLGIVSDEDAAIARLLEIRRERTARGWPLEAVAAAGEATTVG